MLTKYYIKLKRPLYINNMLKNINLFLLLGTAVCFQIVTPSPIREILVIETQPDCSEYFDVHPTINCTICLSVVKIVQKELSEGDKIIGPLLKMISGICHSIYGPTAKQCYDITSNATAVINYITHHNATYLCEQIHIC